MRWKILSKVRAKKNLDQEIVKIILTNRGIFNKKDTDRFFNLSLENVNFESVGISLLQVKKALSRIKESVKSQEAIIVYGDYDVDGICSTAVVWEMLNSIGARTMPYIPDRVSEGYGLSKEGIRKVKKEYAANLIIAVDHGVTSSEEVIFAKDLGIDSIIIDHHLLPKKKPKGAILIHTTRLVTCAIAWLFCRYLAKHFKISLKADHNLDLVALATICDLGQLINENRILVKLGLEKLNKTQRLGLLALIEEAQINNKKIGVYETGFILGPRLNAMGRISNALDSLRLLCTHDQERARNLAKLLEKTNRKRQQIVGKSIRFAKSLYVKENKNLTSLIFSVHESYHEGIIGLVASKLTEEFNLPSIVVAKRDKISKASARSVNGFNIIQAIRTQEEYLIDCGGHVQAAGFTVLTENIQTIKKNLIDLVNQKLNIRKYQKELIVDCELGLECISWKLYQELLKLEPFGVGNPNPLFVSRNVFVLNARCVGANASHLKLKLKIPNTSSAYEYIDAIGFDMGCYYSSLTPEKSIDIAYKLDVNTWDGRKFLQLKLKDIKMEA